MKYYKSTKQKQLKQSVKPLLQVGETASRIGETASRIEDNTCIEKFRVPPIQQSGFFVREPITLPGQEGKLSSEMIDILADIRKRKYSITIKPTDANENEFRFNNVPTHIIPHLIKLRNNNYDLFKGFLMFITNKNWTERDIKNDENKLKWFLSDINYKQRGDTKSNRSKVIRWLSISIPRRDSTIEDTVYESNEEIEASGLSNADQRRGSALVAPKCDHHIDPNKQRG